MLKDKISEQNINTWIKPIVLIEIKNSVIEAEVPNKFIKDWIKENYQKLIEESLDNQGYKNHRLNLSINKQIKKTKEISNEPIEEVKEKKKN